MKVLSKRQQQVLNFIHSAQRNVGVAPTIREIAANFKFKSPRAASKHVAVLCAKGYLSNEPNKARSLRVVSSLQSLRKRVVDIPIFGSIPAGFADTREQGAKGCISVDIASVGIRPTARTFALEVCGDSMIGKHILDGDTVIVEHGQTPRNGDVVAALIDGESTLKTFVTEKGKAHLKAENPKYPKLVPTSELVIQGVMVALIRRRK